MERNRMKQINKRIKVAIVLTAASIFTISGCIKKRPDMVSSRISDPSAYIPISNAIETIDKKALEKYPSLKIVHTIKTGDSESSGDTVVAESVRLSNDSGISFPKYSEITTTAPLLLEHLDKVDVYAKRNSEYELVYKFTPLHLKIYKLMTEEHISHYELTISEKSEKGWLVPIGGYAVRYFQQYKIPDADNRKTNITDYKAVSSENFDKLATHLVLDTKKFIPFVREAKSNVYPSDFFNGEWYFATTIVSAKPGDESSVGYFDSATDSSLRKKATRVKFLRNREFLRAVNVVVDERANITDDQLDDVMNIPATWKDYTIHKVGEDYDLAETLDDSTDYKKRPYVELDFKMTKTLAEAADASRVDAFFKGLQLSDVSFNKDSFSFTILRVSNSIKRKYSFQRVPETNDYTPKVYTLDDQKTYGYFRAVLRKYLDIGNHTRSDFEQNFLMNRFNPNKPIVFRFSTQTPQSGEADINGLKIDYRKIGENAVRSWNRAFELMGAKHGVVLDQSEENELGDFSTNTINIITNLSADGSGGVGPTIDDPATGEIINGTVNVYSATTISSTLEGLRNLLKIEKGLITDTIFSKEIRQRGIKTGFRKEVAHFCPEVISYAKRTKMDLVIDSATENDVLYRCLEKIVPKRIESITVHEMGHTLGLRHNFYGSFDGDNSFKTVADIEKFYPQSMFPDLYEDNIPTDKDGKYMDEFVMGHSSVMDYFKVWFSSSDGINLPVPGHYDVSALAYLYMNKLPVKDSGSLSGIRYETINVSSDAATALKANNKYIKYLYCTDERAIGRGDTPIDSGCALMDQGQTYTEVLDYYFNKLRDDLLIYSKKLDRFSLGNIGGSVARDLKNMAIVYQDWRFKLSNLMDDPTNTRLTGYTQESFDEILAGLEGSDSKIKGDKDLSKRYFNYLLDLSEIPNYYCIVKTSDDEVRIHEFEQLQKKYINAVDNRVIESCEDSVLQQAFADAGETYVTNIGLPVEAVKFSQTSEDAEESFDILGTGAIRNSATSIIGILNPLLHFNKISDFKPSVLDEPALYDLYKAKVEKRILEGLTLTDQLNYAFELEGSNLRVPVGKTFKKFKAENALYDKAFVTLVNSNLGSDISGPKRENLEAFTIGSTQNKNDIPLVASSVRIGSGYFYAVPESTWGRALLDKYKGLKNPVNVDLSAVAPNIAESFGVLVHVVEPLPAMAEEENFVLQRSELLGFMQSFSNAQRENSQNPEVFNSLNSALTGYMTGFHNTSELFRAEQLMATTGQDTFDNIFGRPVVQGAEISQMSNSLATSGLDSSLRGLLGFDSELTQDAILGSYLKAQNRSLYNFWSAKVRENIEEASSFDEDEFAAYKAYLESRISN